MTRKQDVKELNSKDSQQIRNAIVSEFTEVHSPKLHAELNMLTQQIGSQGVDLSACLSSWLSPQLGRPHLEREQSATA